MFYRAVLIVSTVFVVYSCSSEGQSNDCQTESEIVDEQGFRAQLMETVAEENAFLDFKMCSQQLCKQILDHTSAMSREEFDELMYNLNNDDYMEAFINKADIKDGLLLLAKTKEKLVINTDILRLNKTEQTQLFLSFSEKRMRVVIKTRSTECNPYDPVETCEERRKSDYAWAQGKADLAIIGCTCLVEVPVVACLCYAAALANYADDIRLAERAYEDCLKSK
ncbi:MAG: hypothetical protein LUE99_17945 [Bacteroides sp.]|nr:hypothetical protein [Bacteroides sp.]